MKKFKILGFLLIFVLLTNSCYKKDQERSDFFYLKNKNVFLPVWVKGNFEAPQVIIMVHGGPGGDDGVYMNLPVFKDLERKYLMVYYDQRGSGASQTTFFLTEYTADDHVNDLEKLVQLIQEKYGQNKTLQLLGHSWGAMLSGLYLQSGRNRSLIKGWINTDGSYQTIDRAEYDALKMTANQQISLGNSHSFWEGVLKDLAKIDPENLSLMDLSKINSLGFKAENVLRSDDVIKGSQGFDSYNYFFNSAYHPGIYALNELFINTLMFQQAYKDNLGLEAKITNIKTPTCLLWGTYDLVVASSTLRTLKEKLGNLIVLDMLFEASGHSPMISEPDSYLTAMNLCMERFIP